MDELQLFQLRMQKLLGAAIVARDDQDASALSSALDELMLLCGSADRAPLFIDLMLPADWLAEVFWRSLHKWWSSFDLIPHQRMSWLLKQYRDAWKPEFMEPAQLAFYQSLDTRFQVFRGQDREAKAGLSWTTDIETAKQFARGHRRILNPNPIVLSGWVNRSNVLSVAVGRQEAEIVVLSAKAIRQRQSSSVA